MIPEEELVPTGPPTLRPFRVLPGGAQAVPEEWYGAAILAGSMIGLMMIRRAGATADHSHIGGAAAFTFLFYYLLVTGIVRLAAANLAQRRDSPFARALGFFA